ncbi:MAG: hypothetical protein ACR2H3_07400 [Acidimicrobiales bacterium]
MLPPVGWADVATKRDLDALEARMDGGFASLRGEIAEVRADVTGMGAALRLELAQGLAGQRSQLAMLFVGLVGLQMTGAALAVALSRVL